MKYVKTITKTGRTLPLPVLAQAHEGHKSFHPECRDGMMGIHVVGCVNNEFHPLFPCGKI